MELEHNDHPQGEWQNDPLFAPLTGEDAAQATATIPATATGSTRTPLLPVPEDAQPFNFKMPKWGGAPDHLYPYHTESGKLLGYVCRWNAERTGGKKEIMPVLWCALPDGKRAWRSSGFPKPRPLYRLSEIARNSAQPVLICEGEKTAEAAQLLFPDWVATTPMHGARSPHLTDWQPVKGRQIIIAADCDESGQGFADQVFGLCMAAGAASVQALSVETLGRQVLCEETLIKREDEIPDGYDLADAVADGWTAPLVQQFLQECALLRPYLSREEIRQLAGTEDDPFQLRPDGVYIRHISKDADGVPCEKWVWFASFLQVTHFVRNSHSEAWARNCLLIDRAGVRKEYVLPMTAFAGDGRDYRSDLLSLGLELAPQGRQKLDAYLTSRRPRLYARCVDRVGWDRQHYILPGKVYGPPSHERIVLQGMGEQATFRVTGSLADWQDAIGVHLAGNTRLVVAASAAVAAPVLGWLREANFGLHICGGSSIGKTTALHVAASVSGGALHSWRTTDNAAEGLAQAHNHALLLIDELGQVDGKAADAMAYMLGNGHGKARATRSGSPRPVQAFNLIFLSTGEIGLAGKLAEQGRNVRAGQQVRFIELPADAGKGLGLFETLHQFETAAQLATHLRQACAGLRGAPIDAFLTAFAKDPSALQKGICTARDLWLSKNLPPQADGQVARVARALALVAASGELAMHLGIFPWPQHEAWNACAQLFTAWLRARGGLEPQEITETIHRLRAFLAEHGSSRFETPWETAEPGMVTTTRNDRAYHRAGFRKGTSNGPEYYLFPETFQKEICTGSAAREIARVLAEKGIFRKDAHGKSSPSVRIPGQGTQRLYVIPAGVLDDDG
jgi:putative DNA primase/helicase